MLQPTTLQFLKTLKANNNKPWFDANRKKYESAKADFLSLIENVLKAVGKFDPPIALLDPKKCIFRINRDVRFSKDKSPYKTNMGSYFSKDGKKTSDAGYYLHCEPGKSFIAGGFYMPEPAVLAKIRQEIDYNFKEWQQITESKSFKKYFPKGVEGIDVLTRPPKGYDENNPAIKFLKMKSFIVTRPLTDEELQNKSLLKETAKYYETMKPFIDFLNSAIE